MHLHLLHLAETKPLIDVFGEVVSHHASYFDSIDVTGTDPSQSLICSEPTSYTLTVLPDECIGVLNSVYSILHPDIQMPSELPAAVKKFSSIQVNGYKLSSMSEKSKSCPVCLGIFCVPISWYQMFKQFVQLKSSIYQAFFHTFRTPRTLYFPCICCCFLSQVHPWGNLLKFGVKVFLNIV